MVSDMNNLYVISKGDPFHLANDVEPIEYRHDQTKVDDSQSMDLEALDRKKGGENRYHKRFHLRKDAFALIRSISAGPLSIRRKSMGCIACAVFNANPARLGRIDNISMGGLMFQHVASKRKLNKTFVLDILLADCRFYLANLTFKIIADVVLPDDSPSSTFEMRQVRLEFHNLSAYQQARLNKFILNHCREISEISNKV
jgi:hypothetical protein